MMLEIEYFEDGEEENLFCDEGYCLVVGFVLGFINFGKGGDLKGLRDMCLMEKFLIIVMFIKCVELVYVLDCVVVGVVMVIVFIFMKLEDYIVVCKIDVFDIML